MPKPQPWYAQYNQPPRSAKQHGRNWKPSPQTHRYPVDRADLPVAGADPAKDDADASAIWIAWGTRTIYPIFAKPKPPAIPHAGIRAGELTSHRMWFVLDNNELCSVAHYFIWEPHATIEGKIDEPVDSMLNIWSSSPIYGGVYSYFTQELVFSELKQHLEDGRHFPTVCLMSDTMYIVQGIAWGTIKNWGEVVEHERGYRAQYAKLTSIDGVVGAVNRDALRSKYNV